jgi:hypothetical protein
MPRHVIHTRLIAISGPRLRLGTAVRGSCRGERPEEVDDDDDQNDRPDDVDQGALTHDSCLLDIRVGSPQDSRSQRIMA